MNDFYSYTAALLILVFDIVGTRDLGGVLLTWAHLFVKFSKSVIVEAGF